MSKAVNARYNHAGLRWRLLTTVSAISLMASAYSVGDARAAEGGQPLIWLELGSQYDRVTGKNELYIPPLAEHFAQAPFTENLLLAEHRPLYSYGADAAISFRPEDSNWVLSASVKFGRAHGRGSAQQTKEALPILEHLTVPAIGLHHTASLPSYWATHGFVAGSNSESHVIADFQVGRDVGLGIFGAESESVLSAGIRFAQLNSGSGADIHGVPDIAPYYFDVHLGIQHLFGTGKQFHTLIASDDTTRNFRGLGPSLAWSASAPVAGNQNDGELTLDFGLNAAVLFGRQTVRRLHHESGQYYKKALATKYHSSYHNAPPASTRERNTTVPNVGGFAGLSFRYIDAKLSIGYRGDFFFGAVDGGMDARHDVTRGFYGPFATIGIGLGG